MTSTLELPVQDPFEPRMVRLTRREQRRLRASERVMSHEEAYFAVLDREDEIYARNDELRESHSVNVTEWMNPFEIRINDYRLMCLQAIRDRYDMGLNLNLL